MHQSTSFLLSWRKKGRPQTSPTQESVPAVEVHTPRSSNSSPVPARVQPTRRPSDTPSENSTRFLRLFKGSHAETDASSLASLEETAEKPQRNLPALRNPSSFIRRPHSPPFRNPPSPDARTSPLRSPHSLERQLPPVPPVRPPRPPSLNLDAIEFHSTPFTPTSPKPSGPPRSPRQQPLILERSSRRKMPELDDVWEGFMKDVEGENADNFAIPLRRHAWARDRLVGSQQGVQAILDPPSVRQPRLSLYRTTRGSESTPYLKYTPDLTDAEGSESSDDETSPSNPGFSLSLFPAPPPLPVRRRTTPKPLILLPTPTIARLPPSPSFSSRDSTPIATPTTPRCVDPSIYSPRKSASPVSILKKPGMTHSPRSPAVTPPTTPALAAGWSEEPPSSCYNSTPRLRTAQSVPHLHPSLSLATSNAHRNTSSDTTSMSNRRPVHIRPRLYLKAQPLPPPPGNVEWGYAV
ncbi:hypothetical protein DFH09DRAFT_27501 [Mycena vulgaris]|nr:hypothetical protein DFH09DRAFT_27501 [Mycena vulgaris]